MAPQNAELSTKPFSRQAVTEYSPLQSEIKKLIKEEDTGNPLSDSRIAELLSGEGIAVARRTVAKYRESLRIPSSVQRRREKTLRI